MVFFSSTDWGYLKTTILEKIFEITRKNCRKVYSNLIHKYSPYLWLSEWHSWVAYDQEYSTQAVCDKFTPTKMLYTISEGKKLRIVLKYISKQRRNECLRWLHVGDTSVYESVFSSMCSARSAHLILLDLIVNMFDSALYKKGGELMISWIHLLRYILNLWRPCYIPDNCSPVSHLGNMGSVPS
jgi:hypothetical protein